MNLEQIPASKADIQRLEQKMDTRIQQMEQKLDQKIDATDQKHDAIANRMAKAIVDLQTDMRWVKENISTKEDIGRVLKAVDAFAKKAEHYDRASVIHGRTLVEVEVQIKDHEKRLIKLERKS